MANRPAPRILAPEHYIAASEELLEAQTLLMRALDDARRDHRNAKLGRAAESMLRAQRALSTARPMRQAAA